MKMEVNNMLNNDWKERAIERRIENKALKKRIKELIISRDIWNKRATNAKKENDDLKAKLNAVKKKINQINEI
jgi:hypothetical protein